MDSTNQDMQTIFQTCVLSILITAPIGQLIIELLGKVLLNKQGEMAKWGDMGNFLLQIILEVKRDFRATASSRHASLKLPTFRGD